MSQRGHSVGIDSKAGARSKPLWGMVIDLARCTQCGTCVLACRQENNVPVAGRTESAKGRAIFWMSMLELPAGRLEAIQSAAIPVPCMHCDAPPCTAVCPVGATYRNDEGIVAQIWNQCIGCRACLRACPYGRRYFNWSEPAWPDRQRLNPDVALRPAGVVEKCTFCHHRLQRARLDARVAGREQTDAELQRLPACAAACPTEAITFGDLADPHSTVSRLAASGRAARLLEHVGTQPKLYYLLPR